MYYEEDVIDGVLHWRNMPTGEWIAFSPVELTEKLIRMRKGDEQVFERLHREEKRICALEAMLVHAVNLLLKKG